MRIADVAARRGAKLVRANGIDIAYTEAGDGPPLVLLHGGLASAGPAWAGAPVAFVDHMHTLAEHFRVVAPDTRGSGATVHRGGPATFEVLADDVAALIGALGLDRPMLAGFSEGGTTATYVALRHPQIVRALVNHAGFDIFDPHAMAHQSVRPIFGGSPDAARADPDAAERAFRSIPPMAATFATMKADYDDAQGCGHWRTYLELFFERATAPVAYTIDELAAITVPTLVLSGDRDMFCPVETACAVYRTLPAGELGIVSNTGHEISAQTIDAMTAFLIRQAPGT